MNQAYTKLGLPDEAADVLALRTGQAGNSTPRLATGDAQPGNSGWWDRMTGLFSSSSPNAGGDTATDTALVAAAPAPVATAATAGTANPEAAAPVSDQKKPSKITIGQPRPTAEPAVEPPVPPSAANDPQTR